jgi:hypothetical protein
MAFSFAVTGALLWLPVHIFWLVNMFTGGSAGLYFLLANIATYGGAINAIIAIVYGVMELIASDADKSAGVEDDIIPFAGYTALSAGTFFFAFTNLSTF